MDDHLTKEDLLPHKIYYITLTLHILEYFSIDLLYLHIFICGRLLG